MGVIEEIQRMKDDSGRENCTYGDTQYDSLSAVYGYNLALEHVISKLKDLNYYTEVDSPIIVRERKGTFVDDIDCTNCKHLYQVEASGGICKLKDIQVSNENYCNLFSKNYI